MNLTPLFKQLFEVDLFPAPEKGELRARKAKQRAENERRKKEYIEKRKAALDKVEAFIRPQIVELVSKLPDWRTDTRERDRVVASYLDPEDEMPDVNEPVNYRIQLNSRVHGMGNWRTGKISIDIKPDTLTFDYDAYRGSLLVMKEEDVKAFSPLLPNLLAYGAKNLRTVNDLFVTRVKEAIQKMFVAVDAPAETPIDFTRPNRYTTSNDNYVTVTATFKVNGVEFTLKSDAEIHQAGNIDTHKFDLSENGKYLVGHASVVSMSNAFTMFFTYKGKYKKGFADNVKLLMAKLKTIPYKGIHDIQYEPASEDGREYSQVVHATINGTFATLKVEANLEDLGEIEKYGITISTHGERGSDSYYLRDEENIKELTNYINNHVFIPRKVNSDMEDKLEQLEKAAELHNIDRVRDLMKYFKGTDEPTTPQPTA